MKILHVCRQYYPSIGGVERFVANLAGHLKADGYSVEIATLNRLWHSSKGLAGFETVNGLSVHRLPFVGGPLFFMAPTILSLASRFDVLHVHNTDFFLDYLLATQSIHHKPLVVSTHGGFFHTNSHSTFKSLYFRWMTQRSLHGASAVIPNSLSDSRRFGPYARNMIRIDNAIDYPTFASANRQPLPGRLITVGRLVANKNLEGLLRVFAAACYVYQNLKLIVVGDGPLRPKLEALAVELKIAEAVVWLGEVDDRTLLTELGHAEFFLSAASYEGFGLALLEAMAAGVIPIVNRIEAFEALVTEGQNGSLIDYDRVTIATQHLLKMIDLPDLDKNRLSKAAQMQAANYSWGAVAPKFEKVYEQVLSATKNKP